MKIEELIIKNGFREVQSKDPELSIYEKGNMVFLVTRDGIHFSMEDGDFELSYIIEPWENFMEILMDDLKQFHEHVHKRIPSIKFKHVQGETPLFCLIKNGFYFPTDKGLNIAKQEFCDEEHDKIDIIYCFDEKEEISFSGISIRHDDIFTRFTRKTKMKETLPEIEEELKKDFLEQVNSSLSGISFITE